VRYILFCLVFCFTMLSCSEDEPTDGFLTEEDSDPNGSSSSKQVSSSSILIQDFSRAHEVNQKLGRGVNLGNAFDAQCRDVEFCSSQKYNSALSSYDAEKSYVTSWDGCWSNPINENAYFADLRSKGFKSIRLPVRWAEKANDNSPFTIPASFKTRVKQVVDKAIAEGFPVILNIHHYNELYDDCKVRNDLALQKQKFVELWRQIANDYKDYSNDFLVFEILNEGRIRITHSVLNELLEDVWPVIRETNPGRTIMINPADWGKFSALQRIEIPNDPNTNKKDANVILSGHFYEPQCYTHRKESGDCTPGISDWGTADEQNNLKKTISNKVNELKAKYAGLNGTTIPINIGEFGVTVNVNSGRTAWIATAREEFEKHGFSWHYWAYPGAGPFNFSNGVQGALIP